MIRALKAMVAEVTAQKAEPSAAGMTTMHGIAARYLDDHHDVTTVELAAHLRLTKQSASEIVALLEREGYVRRRPHPLDGRARVVELTDEGAAGLARSRIRWNALVAEWEALVGSEDLATVRRVLEAYLEAHPPGP
jgi:DNA-binding MarR family transcriptional regulator